MESLKGVDAILFGQFDGLPSDPLEQSDAINELFGFKEGGPECDPSVTDASVTNASVTNASIISPTASEAPSASTGPTSVGSSDIRSNAPFYDPRQDDMMHETAATDRAGEHQPGPDPLLYPRLHGAHEEHNVLDRPPDLPVHLHSSRPLAPRPGPHTGAIMSWDHTSSPQGDGSQAQSPRSRTLHSPEKTAEVRRIGACLRCSILKVPCDTNDVCARCSKWDPVHCRLVCCRTSQEAILRSGAGPILEGGRWAFGRYQRPLPATGQSWLITVYFSWSDRQGIDITVAECPGATLRIADRSNLEAKILQWAENDLGKGPSGDFRQSIEAFLYLYSKHNCSEKKPLVDNVLRMSSLWRLISASELCCDFKSIGQRPLPDSIASELKNVARWMMPAAEEKVTNEIRQLILNKDNRDTPAVWAALWSVILLYRHALQEASNRIIGPARVEFKEGFEEVTSKLLHVLIVIYSSSFRTRNVLEALDSPVQPSFLDHSDVKVQYDQARWKSKHFYEEFRGLERPPDYDDLIKIHIIDQEQRVTRRRPRGGKQNPCLELNTDFL